MKPWRITVHCSASKNAVGLDIENIRRFHMAPPPDGRGWNDVGYHGVIQPDGTWQQGRGFNEQGAHVEGENEGNIGICLIGTDKFTRQQFETLRKKIDALQMMYDIDRFNIYCHYQFKSAQKQGKTCPNIDINRLLSWLFFEDDKVMEPYVIPLN